MKGELDGYSTQLVTMVEQYPDRILLEYCEYWGTIYDYWLSTNTMCRALLYSKTNTKKKTLGSSQGKTERIQNLRSEYWQQVKKIDPENLVFIDEMGVLLCLRPTTLTV